MKSRRLAPALLALAAASQTALAAPVTYEIDPTHTYPSFEADHMGMSYWRGKLNKNTGSIRYDKAIRASLWAVAVLALGLSIRLDSRR